MALPELRWARVPLGDRARLSALAMLSPAERLRHDVAGRSVAGRSVAGRDSFLAGRMLLRTLAGELTSTPPAEVDLVAVCPDCGGPHGRPVLQGTSLQLSLTHGAGVVVAAASWDAAVGIDVESPDVSPERLTAIGALAGQASVLHWSRVEAVLKADGRGLRVDPARVSIAAGEGWIDDSPVRYEVSEIDLAPGVRVSVAVGMELFTDHR